VKEILAKLIQRKDLTQPEAEAGMSKIMSGEATSAQIAAFITAMHLKGETPDEIAGCARAMRAKVLPVPHRARKLVDTCGTGGDMKHTFNISTVAAFVVAGAGVAVAKHGNRAVSSSCGSADLLEELGVKLNISSTQMGRCIDQVGIGFLFAPLLHPAMKYAASPRRELGFRTIFNILGPLTNPAGAQYQLLGVYAPELTEVMAVVLGKLGTTRALVVHGEDGLDEVTTTTRTKISEYHRGEVRTYFISPGELGLDKADPRDLQGGTPPENAEMVGTILRGDILAGPARSVQDIVTLNAAAALLVAGEVKSLSDGVNLARETIFSGAARDKLKALVEFTQSFVNP